MGALLGQHEFVRKDEIPGQGKQVLAIAKKIKLTNVELDRIFHEFMKHKNPETEMVDIQKMFKTMKYEYSLFARVFFQFFDPNKTGYLTFMEYMIIMWGLLSTDDDGMAALCFNLIDTERLNLAADKALRKLEWNEDGIITVAEFVLLSRHYQILLQPVRELKAYLRKHIVHARFWKEICDKRLDNFQLLTMFDLTERTDPNWFAISMDYLSLQPEVPAHFVEQWKFVQKRRHHSRKGSIPLPYEALDPSLSGVRLFSEKKKKSFLW